MLPPELILPVGICAATAATCFLLSLIFDEYSWVDRIWSVVPPIYIGTFAAAAEWADPRLNLMTALTTLWGLRLTFNYARKGGYAKGGEDYRWSILRSRMSRGQWLGFNAGFIAGYQNFLLLLIALPAWTAFHHQTPLGVTDVVAGVGFVVLLIGEIVADQQQWRFHQQKKARALAGEPEPKGFLDTGLWAWSRHPNFFCEQGQWVMIFVFAAGAADTWLLETAVGPILLILLFGGSAWFTESLTAAKYPAYADYQRRVSRTIPLPRRR